MASYTELLALSTDAAYIDKVREGVLDAAQSVLGAVNPSSARVIFLRQALGNPPAVSAALVWPLLVINQDLSAAQIQGATTVQVRDAILQAADKIFF